MRNKKDRNSKEELSKVEEMLANECAEENAKIVKEACEGISCETGGIKMQNMWKMKKFVNYSYLSQLRLIIWWFLHMEIVQRH